MCTINPLNCTLIPYPLYLTPYIYSLRIFVHIYPQGLYRNKQRIKKQNMFYMKRIRMNCPKRFRISGGNIFHSFVFHCSFTSACLLKYWPYPFFLINQRNQQRITENSEHRNLEFFSNENVTKTEICQKAELILRGRYRAL